MTMVTPEFCDLWNLRSSDLMAWIRGVAGSAMLAGSGGLPGLAPSDQQVFLGMLSSSVDSVLPGRSWPWCKCFLPAAKPSQFFCFDENILSALHLGSAADQGLAGTPRSISSVVNSAATLSFLNM